MLVLVSMVWKEKKERALKANGRARQTKQHKPRQMDLWMCVLLFISNSMNNWMNSELIFTITKTNEQKKTHNAHIAIEWSENWEWEERELTWMQIQFKNSSTVINDENSKTTRRSKWKTECASCTPQFWTGRQLKKTIWQVPLFLRATLCLFQTGLLFFVRVNELNRNKTKRKIRVDCSAEQLVFHMKPAKPTTIVRGPRIHTHVCAPHRFFWIS